jgi:hypothetical protein
MNKLFLLFASEWMLYVMFIHYQLKLIFYCEASFGLCLLQHILNIIIILFLHDIYEVDVLNLTTEVKVFRYWFKDWFEIFDILIKLLLLIGI